MTEFTLNDYVDIQLTDAGRDILRQNRKALNDAIIERGGKPFTRPAFEENEDGWMTVQLWKVLSDFGPSTHLGCEVPFSKIRFSSKIFGGSDE